MNCTLRNKIILLKAKDYASRIEGVSDFNLAFMKDERQHILRDKVSKVIAYSFEQKGREYLYPVNSDSLLYDIVSRWPAESQCSLLFDSNVEISFAVKDQQDFIKSVFSLNGSYDALLTFKNRFIYITDDEYMVRVFDIFI